MSLLEGSTIATAAWEAGWQRFVTVVRVTVLIELHGEIWEPVLFFVTAVS